MDGWRGRRPKRPRRRWRWLVSKLGRVRGCGDAAQEMKGWRARTHGYFELIDRWFGFWGGATTNLNQVTLICATRVSCVPLVSTET